MATSLESFMSNLMINKAQEAQEGSSASSPAGACCSCVSISSDNARMMEHQRRRRSSAPSSRSRSTLLETTEKARQSIVAEALEICKGFGENYDPTIDEAPKLPCRSPDSRALRRKKVVSFTVAKSGIESHRESRWEAATAADCYNKDKQIQALQHQLNNTVPHKPRRSI